MINMKENIFLLGVSQRCGSNYLKNLLLSHLEIESSKLYVEDFLMHELHLINRYVNNVSTHWRKNWYKNNDELKAELIKCIGDGINSFLQVNDEDENRYYLSKTPLVNNIFLFPKIFPNSKLILLIRDGKAVVQSGYKSEFWSYQLGIEKWKYGAERIYKFVTSGNFNKENHILVKYENVVKAPEVELKNIFKFLNLKWDKYNTELLEKPKIFGSSDQNYQNSTKFKWKIVEDQKSFNPLLRSEQMTPEAAELFERKCGAITKKIDKIFKVKSEAKS